MNSGSSTLQRAIDLLEREQSQLDAERDAFEAFREAVRLAKPAASSAGAPTTPTDLRDAYESTVMEPLDYRSLYGDTLAESLEQELSPSLADWLRSDDSLTQRRKRQLLVATTRAIDRRTIFEEEVAAECDSLETYAADLAEIESTVEELPECSPRRQAIETLLDCWERYDALEAHCERLLDRRQQELTDADRTVSLPEDDHAFTEYLYGALDTTFPVLSAIATMCDRIESKRGGRMLAESSE